MMFGECLYPHPFFKGEPRPAVFFSKGRRVNIAFLGVNGGVSGPGLVVDKKNFLEKRS